tara:strand:- start:1107 stop:2996 length:1890 start_codon:yes stop_codon:yes gene_type:complete
MRSNLLVQFIMEIANEAPVRKKLDLPLPADLLDIKSSMKYAGRELYLVGGAVRDVLMGKTPKDYDVATNASPEEVIKILRKDPRLKLDLTGKQFGVVRVKTPDAGEYEIATFREDIGKGKGTSVKFSTIENDVKRRDLTINALFYDMDSGEVVDYVGGIEDIENGIIRAVGDPVQRFDEDRLRILRAVRFAGRTGSDLDPATKQAILEDNELIDTETNQPIPADRITEEFIKGVKSAQDGGRFLALTEELGLFDQILPGLEIDISGTTSQDHIAQVAALLRNNPPDLIVPTLNRMRYSNDEIKAIKFLIGLSTLTKETAPSLKKSFNRFSISPEHLHNFAEITNIPSESTIRGFLEFAGAPPAGNSRELMAQGIKGPALGQALADAEKEAYVSLVGEIRQYIREILQESINDEPDLIALSETLNDMIISLILKPEVAERLNEETEGNETATVLDTGELFSNYDTLNEVHLGIVINDQGFGRVKAYYLCVPEDRSQSNLVIELDIPRNYDQMEEFKPWLEEELEDALSHELQHSCDSTEMLTGDIPEGEAKWESLENIYKHFASEAEIRGNVAGVRGRSRRSGTAAANIVDNKMDEIFDEATELGYNQEELIPVIRQIRKKWQDYLSSLK